MALRGEFRTCIRYKMTDAGKRCAKYRGPGMAPKHRKVTKRRCIRLKLISGGRHRCAKYSR